MGYLYIFILCLWSQQSRHTRSYSFGMRMSISFISTSADRMNATECFLSDLERSMVLTTLRSSVIPIRWRCTSRVITTAREPCLWPSHSTATNNRHWRFVIRLLSTTIRYDTIRDAILTCARKKTWVGLIKANQIILFAHKIQICFTHDSTFSDLYWVCLSVFSCTVLFVSISQVTGCEDRLRNDLYCVEWGVKLYSNSNSLFHIALLIQAKARYNPYRSS